jgi:hypothetical protein
MVTDKQIKEFIRSDEYNSMPLEDAMQLAHKKLCMNPCDSRAASCLHFIAMGKPELITEQMALDYTTRFGPDSGEIIAACQILGLTKKHIGLSFLKGIVENSKDWMVQDAAKDAIEVIEGRKGIPYGNTGETFIYTVFK